MVHGFRGSELLRADEQQRRRKAHYRWKVSIRHQTGSGDYSVNSFNLTPACFWFALDQFLNSRGDRQRPRAPPPAPSVRLGTRSSFASPAWRSALAGGCCFLSRGGRVTSQLGAAARTPGVMLCSAFIQSHMLLVGLTLLQRGYPTSLHLHSYTGLLHFLLLDIVTNNITKIVFFSEMPTLRLQWNRSLLCLYITEIMTRQCLSPSNTSRTRIILSTYIKC